MVPSMLSRLRHDAEPPVDIGRGAGQPPGKRRREIGSREADIVDIDQFADRRTFESFGKKDVEVL